MRILLLSMYYPPLNTIAAHRIKSFEKYLSDEKVEVDVLTRYYDPEQQKGQSMFLGKEAPENFKEKYVVEKNVIYTNFEESNSKLAFSNKLPPGIKGIYNYFNVDVFHYGWMDYALLAFEKEWKRNKYDFIIGSYGPPIVMILTKKISEKYSIPFLIDFRDSYIDENDVSFHLKMKQFVVKRMLKNAVGLIFSTDGMKDYFALKVASNIADIPSCVVYNGVEENVIATFKDNEVSKTFYQIKETHDLLLLHTGTLYQGQNSSFFIEAVGAYNEKMKKKVAIVFLGLAENKVDEIPKLPFIYFLPKVAHTQALHFQKEASALLLPIWDGRYTGFSGKTQEYLFSENYIITSPNPQNDLKLFLDLSPNVAIANDATTFSNILNNITNGRFPKLPLPNKEKLYRKFWVKQLYDFLVQLK